MNLLIGPIDNIRLNFLIFYLSKFNPAA